MTLIHERVLLSIEKNPLLIVFLVLESNSGLYFGAKRTVRNREAFHCKAV